MTIELKRGDYFNVGKDYSTGESFLLGGGLLLTKTRHQAKATIPSHRHQDAYLSIILQGSYEEEVGGARESMSAGTCIYHPPFEVHRNVIGPVDAIVLNVEIPGRFWTEKGLETEKPQGRLVIKDEYVLDLARRISGLIGSKTGSSLMALEGLCLQIVSLILEQGQKGDPNREILENIDAYLSLNFREVLTLQDIAEHFQVAAPWLARTFRQAYGETISERITRLRLQQATHLLLEGKIPLAEIALKVGFFDQAHFSKTFKQKRGITPGRFRRQNKLS